MTTLPLETFLDSDRTTGEMKSQFFGPMLDVQAETPGGAAEQALTIASGAVTPAAKASRAIQLAGEGAADDTLDSVAQTNAPAGSMTILRGNGTDVITLNHGAGGAGQLLLRDGVDYVLDTDAKRVAFMRVGTDWLEIWRSHAKVFESSGLTLAANTSTDYNHLLGGEPDTIEYILECVTAEHNYSVGDRIRISTVDITGSNARPFALWADATQIHVITPAGGSFALPTVVDKTARTLQTITALNWDFKVRAWRV